MSNVGMLVVKVGSKYVGTSGVAARFNNEEMASISFGCDLERARMFESREQFDRWLDSGAVNCTSRRFWQQEGYWAQLVPYAQEAADMITRLVERMA